MRRRAKLCSGELYLARYADYLLSALDRTWGCYHSKRAAAYLNAAYVNYTAVVRRFMPGKLIRLRDGSDVFDDLHILDICRIEPGRPRR